MRLIHLQEDAACKKSSNLPVWDGSKCGSINQIYWIATSSVSEVECHYILCIFFLSFIFFFG